MARRPIRQRFIDVWSHGMRDAGRALNRARDAIASSIDVASGRAESEERRVFLRHFQKEGPNFTSNASTTTKLIADPKALKTKAFKLNNNDIGHLYLYVYKAKHDASLPYWDMFPLIFMVNVSAEHFMGINLHYIPPKARAMLMDAINDELLKNRYDESKPNYDKTLYTKITYSILKNVTKNKMFAPCVKLYLKSHVQSDLVRIPGSKWADVMFLPLARFKRATSSTVYRDSMKR
jgi:hypothetical protein